MSRRRNLRWIYWWQIWTKLGVALRNRYYQRFGDYPDRHDYDDTWLKQLPVNGKNLRDIAKYWRAYCASRAIYLRKL